MVAKITPGHYPQWSNRAFGGQPDKHAMNILAMLAENPVKNRNRKAIMAQLKIKLKLEKIKPI